MNIFKTTIKYRHASLQHIPHVSINDQNGCFRRIYNAYVQISRIFDFIRTHCKLVPLKYVYFRQPLCE